MNVVRFVGKRACRDGGYRAALSNRSAARIDTLSQRPNVTVQFKLNGKAVQVDLDDSVRDFLDVAILAYIADEIAPRDAGADRWTRRFDALVPVRNPRAWEAADGDLRNLLGFLSGDEWRFTWVRRGRIPDYGAHRTRLPEGFGVVCAFSGGVDSFLGARKLLREGKKVVLVGHQADSTTAAAQKALYSVLQHSFGRRVAFVQGWIARSRGKKHSYALPKKGEDSHRARSFLFLALTVAVARAAGIRRIVLPENGLIALNPPLSPSRIGSLSTRTAHPRYLAGFERLAARIGAFDGAIQNPFMYMSKTKVVRTNGKGVTRALRRSVSCSHAGNVRWSGKSGSRHCGHCMPCIYRRIAFMDVGLDDPADYVNDVFRKLPRSPGKRSDLRALARFARRVLGMSSVERRAALLVQGSFTAEEVAHLGPDTSDPFGEWEGMIVEWVQDFRKKIRTAASAGTRRVLGL